MNRKNTDDLRQELMAESDIGAYVRENRKNFAERSLTALLETYYKRLRMTKVELARRSEMSVVYLHQLFSGRRKPSRDRLLCLCVGMELTVDEVQRLLREAAYVQIYPRVKRDAVIYHALVHHTPLSELNRTLQRAGEEPLC